MRVIYSNVNEFVDLYRQALIFLVKNSDCNDLETCFQDYPEWYLFIKKL